MQAQVASFAHEDEHSSKSTNGQQESQADHEDHDRGEGEGEGDLPPPPPPPPPKRSYLRRSSQRLVSPPSKMDLSRVRSRTDSHLNVDLLPKHVPVPAHVGPRQGQGWGGPGHPGPNQPRHPRTHPYIPPPESERGFEYVSDPSGPPMWVPGSLTNLPAAPSPGSPSSTSKSKSKSKSGSSPPPHPPPPSHLPPKSPRDVQKSSSSSSAAAAATTMTSSPFSSSSSFVSKLPRPAWNAIGTHHDYYVIPRVGGRGRDVLRAWRRGG